MENRFNLVDEKWIPVAQQGLVSLGDIFANQSYKALGGNALDKIALMKLLLAIAQSACTPADTKEWLELGVDGLQKACTEYLVKWKDAFWLYGDNAWLQYKELVEKWTTKHTKKKFANMHLLGHSNNAKIIYFEQTNPILSDSDKAKILLINMACSVGIKAPNNILCLGKGVEKKPCFPPGPALCSKGLLHSFLLGNSLLETIWLNLFTMAEIAADKTFANGLGVAPWEDMPKAENDEIAEKLKSSLMGRLVPLSRFMWLEDDEVLVTEGLAHPDFQKGVIDPSMTADLSANGKHKILLAKTDTRPWRSLTSLLGFLKAGHTGFVCPQIKCGIEKLASSNVKSIGIWSGGIQLPFTSGTQLPSQSDDFVESEIMIKTEYLFGEDSAWFDTLKSQMKDLENRYSKILSASISGYYTTLKKNGKVYEKEACQTFWEKMEKIFPDIIEACADYGKSERLEKVNRQIRVTVRDCYNAVCPRETARQLCAWVKNEPHFAKTNSRTTKQEGK